MLDVPKLTDSTFDAEVLQAPGAVMVYFTSKNCGPCKMLEPVLTDLIAEWGTLVTWRAIHINEHLGMAIKHHVLKAPTLMLYLDGKPVERLTGFHPKPRIIATFEGYLAS